MVVTCLRWYMYIYVRLGSTSNPQIHVQFLRLGHLYLRSTSFFKFSNRYPILKSTSFFKFSNWHPILKSMAASHFVKSTSKDVTDLYALTLTNKLAIDMRIWKGLRYENTLKSDRDLR